MIVMLEKYANNLEEIVEQRTEELVAEKKKTDTLLYRMLPSYVELFNKPIDRTHIIIFIFFKLYSVKQRSAIYPIYCQTSCYTILSHIYTIE